MILISDLGKANAEESRWNMFQCKPGSKFSERSPEYQEECPQD